MISPTNLLNTVLLEKGCQSRLDLTVLDPLGPTGLDDDDDDAAAAVLDRRRNKLLPTIFWSCYCLLCLHIHEIILFFFVFRGASTMHNIIFFSDTYMRAPFCFLLPTIFFIVFFRGASTW